MHEPCGLDAAQRQFYREIAALTMSGIIPALACNALLWLCESVGWWLLVPLYVVVGRALWRVMWS